MKGKTCKLKKESFSLLTFSFREGCKSLTNRVSFILQWVSDRPLAKISKWSHFMFQPTSLCAILRRDGYTRPSIWFRYVDDTFTLLDNINEANQFLHYLDSCHANIKFTVEFEENNTISFLDILNKRNKHVFSTSIYRKEDFYWPLHQMGLFHTT